MTTSLVQTAGQQSLSFCRLRPSFLNLWCPLLRDKTLCVFVRKGGISSQSDTTTFPNDPSLFPWRNGKRHERREATKKTLRMFRGKVPLLSGLYFFQFLMVESRLKWNLPVVRGKEYQERNFFHLCFCSKCHNNAEYEKGLTKNFLFPFFKELGYYTVLWTVWT